MGKIDSKLRKRIEAIVGPAQLRLAPAERAVYAYDATPGAELVMPDAVVLPATAEEVAALLALANGARLPVVARGAGTGLTGGARPTCGGLVISSQRMNKIVQIDRENMQAVVQPGVVTEALQEAVAEQGLFYPPDPQSAETCTIGGNLAENAGGPRALKYGVTRTHVLALQAAFADGRLLRFGARTLKSVVGYDITSLLVGSEGTLAFITEASLRLLGMPAHRGTLLAIFAEVEAAAAAVAATLQAGILPSALEFVDETAIRVLPGSVLLPEGARALLVAEVDGTARQVEEEAGRVEAQMKRAGAIEVRRARDQAQADELWKARREVGPALAKLAPLKINEDVVVPISRLPETVQAVGAIGAKHGVGCAIYGHVGDGNLHLNFLLQRGDAAERARVEAAVAETFEAVVALGGSISGEHGIGTSKRPYLGLELSEGALEVMRAVKAALDPNGIMNPGKAI